jgi:hypothetical protein
MPKEDKNTIEFKNIQKMVKVPIAIYGDGESVLEKIQNDPSGKIQSHIPSAVGYYIVNSINPSENEYKNNI